MLTVIPWRGPVDGEGRAEHRHAALRRAVGGLTGEGDARVDRADQHDAPAVAAGDHRPAGGAGAPERPAEVDVDDPPPGVVGELVGRSAELDAGARDEDVEPAVIGNDAARSRRRTTRVGDVEADRHRRSAGGRGGLGRRRFVEIGAHDGVAACAEGDGDGSADPRAGAGDDRDARRPGRVTCQPRAQMATFGSEPKTSS